MRREGGRVGIGLRISQFLRTPTFGIAVLTPVVLAGAVAASPERLTTAVTFAAPAVPPRVQPMSVPLSLSVEPTAGVRIPPMTLSAYRKAEQTMAAAAPGCGVSWNLLAGIGRIEAPPARSGNDARGTNIRRMDAPARNVSTRGNAGGRPVQAMGPMKLLPGTWSRFASDGDGDGKSDPQNLFDAALTTARYLCSGGLNLRNETQAVTAVLRFNNSMAYAQNVLGWAAAYATGFAPLNLPPISGPVPRLGPGQLPAGPGPRRSGPTSFEPATQLALGNSTQAVQMLPDPGLAAAAGSVPPKPLAASQSPPPPPPPPAPALAAPQPPAPWVAPPPSPGGTAPAGTGNAGSSRPAVEPKIAPPPDVAPESQPQPQRRRAEQTAADSAVQPSAQSPDKNDKRDAGGGRGKKNSR